MASPLMVRVTVPATRVAKTDTPSSHRQDAESPRIRALGERGKTPGRDFRRRRNVFDTRAFFCCRRCARQVGSRASRGCRLERYAFARWKKEDSPMTSGPSYHLLIVALLVTALAWAAPAPALTLTMFTDSGANVAAITDT